MGHEHLRKLEGVKELALKGTFDVKDERQKLALSLGTKAYPSFQAVLDDPHVAVVLIATPNDSHRDLAVAALHAGKHVICEKPVALNAGELDDIVRASKEADRLFMVHQNRRWDEDFLTVKKILDDGTLGKFFHLETRVLGSRGIPGDWRKVEKFGGGMMLDWGVHLLDRLVFLIPGRITQVFCKLNYPTGQEVDEGFHLFLTFASGHTALIEVGTCHYQSLPLWLVLGTQGTAVIHDWSLNGGIVAKAGSDADAKPIVAGAGLTKTMAPRTETGEVHLPLPVVKSDVRDFYRNFAAAALGKEEPLVKNTEVRRILKLMEAAFESHRTGQVVAFE
jgi:predicted dehydrogenase